MNLNLPKLIGHRGVKDIAPENTLESINRAIDFKLKWIEVDVKISKDHIPFLLHDDDLNRTTTGIGSPLDLNYKEIRKLDAGQWFDKKYKGAYPPTLKEVMQLCSQKKIGINIELTTKMKKLLEESRLSDEQYKIRKRYLPESQNFGLSLSNRSGMMEKNI